MSDTFRKIEGGKNARNAKELSQCNDYGKYTKLCNGFAETCARHWGEYSGRCGENGSGPSCYQYSGFIQN